MRKLFLFLIFAFAAFLMWNAQCNINEQFHVDGEKRLNPHPVVPPKQVHPLLDEINLRNAKITSFRSDVEMVVKLDRSFRLTGTVPENLRKSGLSN